PLHPALVHIPLGLAVVLPLVALGVTVALARNWLAPRSFAVVVLLQALLLGAGFAALKTGQDEEDRVERVVPERALHAHEEAAERFLVGAGISLAIGAAGLFFLRRERALRWIAAGATAATVAVAALAVGAGKPGGELVYVHGAAGAYAGGAASAADGAPADRRDDDDD
ncbi:MAG TPA: DUF2231 domain-containing protein, partial [Myxococcales bacterium]|nr:DUF2231 domain-containing protein [Myxococcales bacterium]